MYILGGLGLAGVTLTCLKGRSMMSSMQQDPYVMQGQTMMSPIVRSRIANTLGFFGYGLGATASIVFSMRNSMRMAMVSPWVILPASIVMALGTFMTDYEKNRPLKMLLYTGFCGVMAVNMLPLI